MKPSLCTVIYTYGPNSPLRTMILHKSPSVPSLEFSFNVKLNWLPSLSQFCGNLTSDDDDSVIPNQRCGRNSSLKFPSVYYPSTVFFILFFQSKVFLIVRRSDVCSKSSKSPIRVRFSDCIGLLSGESGSKSWADVFVMFCCCLFVYTTL